MILEHPTSLPAILRNERRRIIAARIQEEIQQETSVLDAFARISGELKVSNGEVLEVLAELTRHENAIPQHAQ